MNRVTVKPELLHWARERAGRSLESLTGRFPRLDLWERGEAQPTLKQLEGFAKATHTPIGYLFLREPPVERVPIPDLRTIASERADHPSPDMLDTIYLCQRRQAWYSDWMRSMGEEPRSFVGSARLDSPVEATGAAMRRALGFDLDERRDCPTWTEALRRFIAQADEIGILVMVSGVVGSNNHRKLDPTEFRGFAECGLLQGGPDGLRGHYKDRAGGGCMSGPGMSCDKAVTTSCDTLRRNAATLDGGSEVNLRQTHDRTCDRLATQVAP